MDRNQKLIAAVCLIALIIVGIAMVEALYANYYSMQYDVQQGLTIAGNSTYMAYNITPISQSDSAGMGQAYLLNCLSNKGYWYQYGVSYNWTKADGDHYDGFQEIFLPWNPKAAELFPYGPTLQNVSIRTGDKVLLSMYFLNGNMLMSLRDWNNGFAQNETYPSYNATYCVGGPYENGINAGTASSQGENTGLLTEQDYPSTAIRKNTPVSYVSYGMPSYNASIYFVTKWVFDPNLTPGPLRILQYCQYKNLSIFVSAVSCRDNYSIVASWGRNLQLDFGNISMSLSGSTFTT